MVQLYFKAYPGVKKYIEDSHKMALWNRLVITPFHQRRREYGANPVFKKTAAYNASLRNGQNVLIQSATSTLGLITFSALNDAVKLLGAESICTVYDSVEIQCPVEKAAEVIQTAFYYLNEWPQTQFDFLELPIGCEGEIGYNWGNCEVVHQGVTQQEVEAVLATLR
jgi:DNA polymerase I-like protein with 3'-5' exonuclease and polymerase domains